MKTSHPIALTATIVAFAAPTASARPLSDPPGSHTSKPTAPTSASIAATVTRSATRAVAANPGRVPGHAAGGQHRKAASPSPTS